MQIVKEWDPNYIESLTYKMKDRLEEKYSSFLDFVTGDGIDLREDELFEEMCQELLEYEGLTLIAEENDAFITFLNQLYDAFHKRFPHFYNDLYEEIENEVNDYNNWLEEQRELHFRGV